MLPSIKTAARSQNTAKNTILDLLSDGLHPSNFRHIQPQRDSRSNGLHHESVSQAAQDALKDFPRVVAINSNRINHCIENSVNSNHSDDEDGYDMFQKAGDVSKDFFVKVVFI